MRKIEKLIVALAGVVSFALASPQGYAATALSATSCTDAGVMTTLSSRETAFAAKNITALGNLIDTNFLKASQSKTALLTQWTNLFNSATSVQMALGSVSCSPNATAGLEDVVAFQTITQTVNGVASSQMSRQHFVLKSDGAGGWTFYGNQKNFDVQFGTGIHADPVTGSSWTWLYVNVSDPANKITGITISGSGISGTPNLYSSSMPNSNGTTGKVWGNINPANGVSIFPTNTPALPVTYTLTITDNTGTTTKTLNYTALNTHYPTALSPSGNYTATTPPAFSWTAPASGQYAYGVNLINMSTGTSIWNSLTIPGTSMPYAGSVLVSGQCYGYHVQAHDINDNVAEAEGFIGINTTACLPSAPNGTGMHTASGTYTWNSGTSTFTLNTLISDFLCNGPELGVKVHTGVVVTATTMTWAKDNMTWTRSSGTAGNIVGIWTSTDQSGNSYTLTVNTDSTLSATANMVSCLSIWSGTGSDQASNHWLNINIDDPMNTIQSAVLSYTGAASVTGLGTGALSFSTGTKGKSWSSYFDSTNSSAGTFNGVFPTLPITYTLTITETGGAVTSKQVTYSALNPNFASNLAPAGNYTGATAPTFTWTAPPNGSYTYVIEVAGLPRTTGSFYWSDNNVGSVTSASYAGSMPLPACSEVSLYAADANNNQSMIRGHLGNHLPTELSCGTNGIVAATGYLAMSGTCSLGGKWVGTINPATGALSIVIADPDGTIVSGTGQSTQAGLFTATAGTRSISGMVNITTGAIAGSWIDSTNSTTANISGNVISAQGNTDHQAPTDPTSLVATLASATQVSLTWTASTDNVAVTGYKVYRNGILLASPTGTATSYSDTGLSAPAAYNYQVAACDAANNCSAQSNAAPILLIPGATITLDGAVTDWGTIAALATLPAGQGVPGIGGDNFKAIYAARDATNLYLRLELYDTFNTAFMNYPPPNNGRYYFAINSNSTTFPALDFGVAFDANGQWAVGVNGSNGTAPATLSGASYVKVSGSTMELKIPLADIGNPTSVYGINAQANDCCSTNTNWQTILPVNVLGFIDTSGAQWGTGILLPRLNGQALYDPDRNVTWLSNANLAASNAFGVTGIAADGSMNWSTAQSWIAAMNAANYLGYNDWRLPATLVPDATCTNPTGQVFNNCTGSEMGHLFHSLGGVAGTAISVTHDANHKLFSNIHVGDYWSGTASASSSGYSWVFLFDGGPGTAGYQTVFGQSSSSHIMAVRTGDVVFDGTFAGSWNGTQSNGSNLTGAIAMTLVNGAVTGSNAAISGSLTSFTGTVSASGVITANIAAGSNGCSVDLSGRVVPDSSGVTSASGNYSLIASGTCNAASGTWSVTQGSAADTQNPSVPSGLTATAASATQINLSWAASTDNVGVTDYKVYQNGQATPVATLGNGVSDLGGGRFGYNALSLTASTQYSYTVVACDAANNCSSKSSSISATTSAATGTGTTTTNFDTMFIGRNITKPGTTENFGVSLRFPRAQGDTLKSYSIACTGAATVTGNFTAAGVSAGSEWVNVHFGNTQPTTPLDCTSTVTYTDNTTHAVIGNVDHFIASAAYVTNLSLAANASVTSLSTVSWTAPTVAPATGNFNYQGNLWSVNANGGLNSQLWFVGSLNASPISYNGSALTANTNYQFTVATIEGNGTNKIYAAQIFTPFCYQCTSTSAGTGSHTASGTYTWTSGTNTLAFNATASSFTCDGLSLGTHTKTATITATTMTMANDTGTWARSSGTANDIVGTWTLTDSTTGNSFTLIFNTDLSMSLAGNIVSCGSNNGGSGGSAAKAEAQHWSSGYQVQLRYSDQSRAATSVSVSGHGLTGSVALTYNTAMSSWGSGTTESIISLGTASPTGLPWTYTFSIADANGTSTSTSTVSCFEPQFVSNISATTTGMPLFSWSGIADANAVYGVQVNDSSGNWVWADYNVTGTSVTYSGPVLASGTYSYVVSVQSSSTCSNLTSGGGSHVAGNFSYTAAANTGGTTLNFVSGWNLAGNSVNTPLNVTALGNDTQISTVWKWIPATSQWAFYTPSMTPSALANYAASKGYAVLATINGKEGFWVNAKVAFTTQMPTGAAISSNAFADQLNPPNNLPAGWSLIAIGDNKTPQEFATAISTTTPSPGAVPTSFATLWAWDGGLSNWYFYAPSLENQGTLASYITAKGYLNFSAPVAKKLGPAMGFWVNHP